MHTYVGICTIYIYMYVIYIYILYTLILIHTRSCDPEMTLRSKPLSRLKDGLLLWFVQTLIC